MEIITNETPIDKMTLLHICIAIIFGLFNTPFLLFFVIIIIWEYIEIYLQQREDAYKCWLTEKPESPINRVTDIVFGIIGWLIGYGIYNAIFWM